MTIHPNAWMVLLVGAAFRGEIRAKQLRVRRWKGWNPGWMVEQRNKWNHRWEPVNLYSSKSKALQAVERLMLAVDSH